MCKKERRGGKKNQSKDKEKEEWGKKQVCLLMVLFQFPDFTEDNNLMGGSMTWPSSHKIS